MMTKGRLASSLPQIPEIVVTKSGVRFAPSAIPWRYMDGTKSMFMNFGRVRPLAPEVMLSFKKVVIWYIENKAAGTADGAFKDLHFLFKNISLPTSQPLTVITDADLLTLRATLRERDGHDRMMIRLRGHLLRWHAFGYPGVSDAAAKYLKAVRMKAAPPGARVSTADPTQGPYTDIERESLLDALSSAYGTGAITLQQYVLGWLVVLFGQRPKQYALLKLCDLVRFEEDGIVRYRLSLPLIKGFHESARTRFQDVELISELAELFCAYKDEVMKQFDGILDEPEQAPFFPARGEGAGVNVKGFEYHGQSRYITQQLKRAFGELKVRSERTGDDINVTTYRFRYTLGTNCIREGLGIDATAKRLGHMHSQSVKPYVALAMAYEALDRIEFATAARLGTLAQAFKGTLVANDLEKDSDTSSHLLHPGMAPDMTKPMGSCGKHGYCNFNKPIACYTCVLFRAWLDGPHQAVFAYLEKDRDRLRAAGCDETILRINDRTMIAVAQVISMCEQEMSRRREKG